MAQFSVIRIVRSSRALLLLIPLLLLILFMHNIPSLWAEQKAQTTADYRLTFTSTWSQETHPHPDGASQFPTSSAHYSRLIGGTHNASVTFWSMGQLASNGIEEMAETGGTGGVRDEVEDAINAGTADQVLLGPNLGDSPDSATYDFTISSDYPLITLVSMIAPSPDWFVGVDGLSLQDEQGEWINELVIDLAPYDSGTDDGSDYRSGNADSNPAQAISDLTGIDPFSPASMGTFRFVRLDAPEPTPTFTPTNTPTETPLPQADLVVTSISIEPEDDGTCLVETSVLGYRVTVANNGSANAGSFDVALNGTLRQSISGLNAGTSTQLWFAGYNMGEVSATVDPDNQIGESDETNNVFTTLPPIPILPPLCTPTPNMTPTDILSSTATPTMTPTMAPTMMPTVTATATPVPAISIVAPADGMTVTLPFMLEVSVQNWSIQEDGQHYHWMIDGIDQGPVFSTDPVTIVNLTPGSHLLTVALAKTDHTFINVQDTVTIHVASSTAEDDPTATPTITATPTAMSSATAMPTAMPTATPTLTPTATEQSPTGVDTETAQYQVSFASTWSNETHPYSGTFPSSAHYSPLIGAIHNDQASFWSEGVIATDGIEVMAETGGTSTLRNEIQNEIDAGNARQIVSGGGLGRTPGTLSTQPFTATKSHPLLTLVTMIAPSPDWFVGVHDLSLLDENGMWRSELSFDLLPYDAGTDDGPDYTSANANSNPPEPIRNITGVAPFSTQPLGTFTMTRVDVPTNTNLEPRIYLSVLLQ